jgi:Tol biopolymer transport system component
VIRSLIPAFALCAGLAQAGEALLPNGQRVLEFSATEGTWMSLDVHPRGDSLVFDLLGDLYVLPVSGGEARLLLGGVAFESQPVFSPDGSRIAFVSDRSGSDNLWIANADGSGLRQLSRDTGMETFSSPAWSRDGQSVFVSRKDKRRDEFGLWLYDLAGGLGVRLEEATKPPGEMLDAAPTSDGRSVFYSGKSRAAATLFFSPNWDVLRRDLRSGATEQVVTAPGGAMRPVLSPDGRQLIYGTRFDGQTGLRMRDLATGEDRWILYPIDDDAQGDSISRGLLPGFAFLPAGDALIIGYGGKLRRIEIPSARVEDIPFTAKVRLDLGPSLSHDSPIETGPVRARLIQGPTQSPDGRQIAFSALSHLYTADLRGGAPRRLVPGDDPQFQPAWSPDRCGRCSRAASLYHLPAWAPSTAIRCSRTTESSSTRFVRATTNGCNCRRRSRRTASPIWCGFRPAAGMRK